MAVYTTIEHDQLASFLEDYDIGTLVSYEGIEQGVSNTNYHLYTSDAHYILTLFEPRRVSEEDLPFFLAYATHLADADIPSARAIKNNQAQLSSYLADRPAAIMSYMEGEHPEIPSISSDLCTQLGATVAKMHKAGAQFSMKQDNQFSLIRWGEWIESMGSALDGIEDGLKAIVDDTYLELKQSWPEDLPAGAIHGDLFPDNVFIKDGVLSGLIDFHFACTDFFAYDLAIIVNAWCFDEHCNFVKERYDSLLSAYIAERDFLESEQKSFGLLLKGAALRFLLSRCEEVLNHKADDLVLPHDPKDYIKRLAFFKNSTEEFC